MTYGKHLAREMERLRARSTFETGNLRVYCSPEGLSVETSHDTERAFLTVHLTWEEASRLAMMLDTVTGKIPPEPAPVCSNCLEGCA